MTDTEIHHEIHDVLSRLHDGVRVPPPDGPGVRRRAASLRRRRTTARAALALGAAACAVVAAATILPRTSPVGPGPSGPERAVDVAPSTGSRLSAVPVAVDGRLEMVEQRNAGHTSDLRVQRVLGTGGGGVVVLGADGHLLLAPLGADGRVLPARDLADGRRVTAAVLAPGGLTLAFVDPEGVVHVRETGADTDLVAEPLVDPDATLASVDGTTWAELDGARVVVRDATGDRAAKPAFPPLQASLADGTLAVMTLDGVELFEASSGELRYGSLGWNVGALAPDGRHYVSVPDPDQLAMGVVGVVPGIEVIDTAAGELTEYDGFEGPGVPRAVAWQDDDRFLVVGTEPQQPGNRLLWDCSLAVARCTQRYDDPGGTLALASR